MIRPIIAALVQQAPPPSRVRRRRDRQKIAVEQSLLGEPVAEAVGRRPTALPSPTPALDGSGGRSAPRTVAPELLAVLMTLRHGG